MENIVSKKRRLVDVFISGAIDENTYQKQKVDYEAEEVELLAKMEKINQNSDKFEEMANCIFDFAANAGKYFESSKIDEKHELLKIIVSNSLATGSKLKVSLEKPFDFFVKNDERLLWRRGIYNFRTNYPYDFAILAKKSKNFHDFF